MANISV